MAPSLEQTIVLARYARTVAADHRVPYVQAVQWMNERPSEVAEALHSFATAEEIRAWARVILAMHFV